ncbi:TRIC cation channel family protein [Microbacterium sp. YMB-B2]|uniref:TRIC cation channel family protein n=1 Tax=Microbacterium tenebrionis TaxID=2830665 RepID=A0A9X1S0A1_9MICO|nr:TRIC cation channel family protein [Microbacterium tenebrionis]MCC2030356.1 TRIC cation channel family protein [Microbacterium tenebrionis]
MNWALTLDLVGVFFFAISGSLLAVQRGYDIVGSLLLGSLTGLGGGVIRDLIIGVPPTAFAEPVHLAAPVAAAALVFFLTHGIERYSRPLLIFDAAGLALFCTTGTVKALEAGMNPVAAALLGVTTGVGGGLLRDVVANRDPQLFNSSDLYAVPAFIGATVVAGAWFTALPNLATVTIAAAVVFAFRVLSLRFRWRIPHAKGQPRRGRASE